jgi:hypothetical protein
MKQILQLILLCFPFLMSALAPTQKTNLANHLLEVNAQWLNHSAALPNQPQIIAFDNDKERIATHLTLVEKHLRNNPKPNLTQTQLSKRAHHLNMLRQYIAQGIFPTNSYHDNRQPYFVDIFGVHCAVGYLLQQDQQIALVSKIKQENNYGYLPDLASQYPAINNWAAENGFDLAELAWVQPTYAPDILTAYPLGNNGGCDGTIHTIEIAENGIEDLVYFGGSFTEVDGVQANNIIAFDGNNWITFGTGLDGVVFDIINFQDKIVALGDFVVPGDSLGQNIAFWDDSLAIWVAMQHGDMGGYIKKGEVVFGSGPSHRLITIGDFSSCNNDTTFENMAAWIHYCSDDTLMGPTNFDGRLTTNGPLYDMIKYQNSTLLIGGDFTQTAINCSFSYCDSIETNHLAYLDGSNLHWVQGFINNLPPVEALTIHDGRIIAGVEKSSLPLPNDPISYVFEAGLWSSWPFYGNKINGFVKYQGNNYAFGDFTFYPGLGNNGYNLSPLFGNGMFVSNGQITAASANSKLYLAGDFTTIFSSTVNKLAWTKLEAPVPTQDLNQEATHIYAYENQVTVKEINLNDPLFLTFYDVNGQILHEATLNPGFNQETIEFDHPSGFVFYTAKTQKNQSVGKLVMVR